MAHWHRGGPLALALASLVAPLAVGAWSGPAAASSSLDFRFALVVAPAAIGQVASLAWLCSPALRTGVLAIVPLLHLLLWRSPPVATLDTVLLLVGFPTVLGVSGVRVVCARRLPRLARAACLLFAACLVAPFGLFAWVVVSMQVEPALVRLLHSSPAPYPGEEEVTLTANDGVHLASTLSRGRPDRPCFLLLHGHADGRSRMAGWARDLGARGASTLRLDLRGHGQSEGVVVSFGDREVLDLEAGLHRLAAQPGVSCSRIGILAASMGGGIALADSAYLADFGVAGIVGFAPASDYGVIIDSKLPAGPMRQVLSTTLDTITRALGPHPPRELDAAGAIARAGVPVLVFHGRSDSTVPPEATQRLADLAPNVRVVWMDTASHADLPDIVLASRPLRHQVLAFLGLDD